MLIRPRPGRLDDPLLEFVAQVVVLELADECGIVPIDQPPPNQTGPSHDSRRDLRPLLDREAGPLLD